MIRITRALIVLINSYYDTGFEHFKKLSEGLFVRLKEECWSAFGNASSAEMLLLKPQIIRMMDSTSVNKSRTLALHPNTLRILERLEYICNSVAKSTSELLLRHLPLLSELHQRILSSYNITPGITHTKLLEFKQTELSFDIDAELQSQNLKKENEYLVIYEYLVKTRIMEVLILTTRDLIMSYPLLTNPLKVYSVKLMSALFRYDMFLQSSLEILEQHMHVPEQVENDVFIHSNQDNKYSMPDLPYVASFEEFLLVCS